VWSGWNRIGAALILASAAGASELRLFESVEPAMGTLFQIKLYADGETSAAGAFRAAFDRVRELDDALSDYQPDSELNRIAKTAVQHPRPVSSDLFSVLEASQELAEKTNGAFDVTLGPVIRLWREARRTGRRPDPAALREAASRCGYRNLRLDAANGTATFAMAGMQLDVGGIAKGYAADAALAVLKRLGITRALVAASGDLALGDPPPGRRGLKIGLQSETLELSNTAVSTSGDAEQGLDADGRRYSHIIDPVSRTGLTDRITVTIIAPRGVQADGIATAVSVLGVKRGLEFVEREEGIAALIAVRQNGEEKVFTSARFKRVF
jgi:thiamine biosynthesis lipoprotein